MTISKIILKKIYLWNLMVKKNKKEIGTEVSLKQWFLKKLPCSAL